MGLVLLRSPVAPKAHVPSLAILRPSELKVPTQSPPDGLLATIVLRSDTKPSAVAVLFEMPPPLPVGAELSAIVTLVRLRTPPFSIPPPLPAPITRLPLTVTLVSVASPLAWSGQPAVAGVDCRPQPLVIPPPPQ